MFVFVFSNIPDEDDKWNWFNETEISNLNELLSDYDVESPKLENLSILPRSSNQNIKNKNQITLDFKISDSEKVFALNMQRNYLVKNCPEPQKQPMEIIKICDMIKENGNIMWLVLYKGNNEPTVISHDELRIQNPQLISQYYQKFLVLNQ